MGEQRAHHRQAAANHRLRHGGQLTASERQLEVDRRAGTQVEIGNDHGGAIRARKLDLRLLAGGPQAGQGASLLGVRAVERDLMAAGELRRRPRAQRVVDVLPAQKVVARVVDHPQPPLLGLEQRHVQRSAPEDR